ncbi:hypothetical protein VULLAG_LOCUS12057 [Vulpes lagopus]
MYQVFTTVQQVLSHQFHSTLSPTLGTWLDQKFQDTWQSLHCACFEVKGACVHVKLHDWDLKCHVPLTLMPWELLQLTEAEAQSEVPAPWLLPAAEPERASDGDRDTPSSVSTIISCVRASITSISCSRSGTRSHIFFCMCARS